MPDESLRNEVFDKMIVKFQSTGGPDNAINNGDFRGLIDRLATDPTVVVEFQNFGKLDKAIAAADVDQNGSIDRTEFGVLMQTGFISLEELNRCLDMEAGPPPTPNMEVAELPPPTSIVPATPGANLKDILGLDLYEAMKECYDLLDMNNDGTITKDEVACLLAGPAMSDHFISSFDVDDDGQITLAEMLLGTSEVISAGEVSAPDMTRSIKQLVKLLKVKRDEKRGLDDLIPVEWCCGEDSALCECAAARDCWTQQVENRIMMLDVADIRKVLRICNGLVAIILLAVIIGCAELYSYADTLPGAVLNAVLLLWSMLVFILELRCNCCGIDKYLAQSWTMVYMGGRRATFIAVSGILCIGLGTMGALVGMLVIFPYGLITRYIIAVHPLCGEVFITTDPEFFITNANEIIQPQDKFIMDAALRSSLMLTPFAFDKFEAELAPVRIMQAMDRVRLQKKLEAAQAGAMDEAASSDQVNVSVASTRETNQAKLDSQGAGDSPLPIEAQRLSPSQ